MMMMIALLLPLCLTRIVVRAQEVVAVVVVAALGVGNRKVEARLHYLFLTFLLLQPGRTNASSFPATSTAAAALLLSSTTCSC